MKSNNKIKLFRTVKHGTMFLKVNQGSPLYDKLYEVIINESLRNLKYQKWQRENLSEFNGDVLTQRSLWYIYAEVVGWKFEGIVDRKVWQPVKGWEGYYEPNKRTKAGKAMRERIMEARGEPFNRLALFDMFSTSIPIGGSFIVPNAFAFDDICYVVFDDRNYKEITDKLSGQFEEITRGEWEEAAQAYNKQNKH